VVIVPCETASQDENAEVGKRGSIRHVSTLPVGTDSCDVYVGIAADRWQTAATCEGSDGASVSTTDGKTVLFSQAYRLTGGVMAPISDNLSSIGALTDHLAVDANDFRVVAITTDGAVVPADKVLSSGASAEFRLTTAVFPTLKLQSIKAIKVQIRPFRWVRFPNVALDPKPAIQPERVLAAQPDLMPGR
jgi:hypothetical protein